MVLEDIDGGVYECDGQGPEGFCAVSVLACGHGDESVVERGGLRHAEFFIFLFCVAIGKREVKIHRVDAERSI